MPTVCVKQTIRIIGLPVLNYLTCYVESNNGCEMLNRTHWHTVQLTVGIPGKRKALLLLIAPAALVLFIVIKQWLWLRHVTVFDWERSLNGQLLDMHVEPGTHNIYLLALDASQQPAQPVNTKQYLLYRLDGNGSVQWSCPFRQMPPLDYRASDENAWIEDVDGTVIVANNSGERFAITEDGRLDWAADRHSMATAAMALGSSPIGAVISGDDLVAYDRQGRACWRFSLPQYPNLASRQLYPAAEGGWLVYSSYEPHKFGEPGWDPEIYMLTVGLQVDSAGGNPQEAEVSCKLSDYDRAVNHRFGNGNILSMEGYGAQAMPSCGFSFPFAPGRRYGYAFGPDPLQEMPERDFGEGYIERVQFEDDCAWVQSGRLWRLDQDGTLAEQLGPECASFHWDAGNGLVSAEWVDSPRALLSIVGFLPFGDTLELKRSGGTGGGQRMIRVDGKVYGSYALRVDGNEQLFALASQDNLYSNQFELHGRLHR